MERPTARTRRRTAGVVAIAASALLITGCSPIGSGPAGSTAQASVGADQPIEIGATIPLSGTLAGFGSFLKWGYTHAVEEANAAGGVTVDGTKHKVKLILLDDKSDPNTVTTGIRTLIAQDHVDALLGSCTPDLVNPGAVVADTQGVPFVSGCDPIEVFKSVKKWTWAWDIFFSVPELAAAPFETMSSSSVATNKKVFILHDNGPDGQAIGTSLWPAMAKQNGYDVVGDIVFPADNTDFSAAIQKGKQSGADVLLIDSITPAAISIRKQMAAAGWNPKVVLAEKGGEPIQFAQALGNQADGLLVGAYWDASFDYPGAAGLKSAFEKETGLTSSQHIADSYSAARVLLDAIAAAGSLTPAAINTAIGKTKATYAIGPVAFDANHAAKIAVVESQWQGGKPVIVWPLKQATGKLLFPVPSN